VSTFQFVTPSVGATPLYGVDPSSPELMPARARLKQKAGVS
jgi:hypothetical protein